MDKTLVPVQNYDPEKLLRKSRGPGKTQKMYSHPERLLEMYRFMEAYFKQHQRHVTNREMVTAGFCGSTSVFRFYLDHMIRFGMAELTKMTNPDGTEYTPARGIRLLDLKDAHPTIQALVKAEKSGRKSTEQAAAYRIKEKV